MSDLADRVQRVRLLLESLNDPYPLPRAALEPDSGPAASRYVPCETCGRRGEVRVRGGLWRLCLVCDGRGWRRRQAGEPAWDAYMSLRLDEAAALPRASAARRPETPETEESFAWERARRLYDRHGSYRAVRRQLSWLAAVEPRRHALVLAVHVDHEPLALDELARVELDLGVLALTLRLGRVSVPPWLVEAPEAERRRETVEGLAAAGMTAGAIGRRLGIPKGTVRKYMARDAGKIRASGSPLAGCKG